jgi:hypothetical protein
MRPSTPSSLLKQPLYIQSLAHYPVCLPTYVLWCMSSSGIPKRRAKKPARQDHRVASKQPIQSAQATLRPPFLFTFYRTTRAPPAPCLLAMRASTRSSNYQGRNSLASHCFSIALSSSTSVFLQNTNGDPTYSKTRHGMCCRHRL